MWKWSGEVGRLRLGGWEVLVRALVEGGRFLGGKWNG